MSDRRRPPPILEDDDLLEMVNAGLIPAAVVHDFQAGSGKKVFPGPGAAREHAGARRLRTGRRRSARAIRNCATHSTPSWGSSACTVPLRPQRVERRYLVNTRYVKNARRTPSAGSFWRIVGPVRKYSDQYDMDFLLMAAQGYQESRPIRARRARGRHRRHAAHAAHRQGDERRRHHR